MRTIAVVNQKGGTGKTTTAVNLAAALAEKDQRVLVIDVDPQASATSWYAIKDPGRGLLDVFTDNRNLLDIICKTDTLNVEIVPSSTWLVGVERALATEVGAETILKRAIAKLPPKRWEYILLDCPPTLGILAVNALAVANEVLVPVEAHVMALNGLVQLLKTVEVVKERLNASLRISGILACRVDARTRHAQEVVEQLRSKFGNLVYNVVIRENVRIAEAPSFGQPITQYDTKSAGAEDYRTLAKEIIARGA